MARLEIQGIVSSRTGEPLVQIRNMDDEGKEEFGFQVAPMEAREIAQNLVEAAANAIYDAALTAWAKEVNPHQPEMAYQMISIIREYRADRWGLPDQPKDWTE